MERRRSSAARAHTRVTDAPAGTPYRVFTTACDRLVQARNAPALLGDEDQIAGIGPPRDLASWEERLAAVEQWTHARQVDLAAAAARLRALFDGGGGDLAVTLLIDHSGSMKDQMVPTAATVRWFSAFCD